MAGKVMAITREDPIPALEKFWKLDTFNAEVSAMRGFMKNIFYPTSNSARIND